MYEFGKGVEINYEKAFEFYEKASKFDNSYALNNMGAFYASGKGKPINYEKAKECYLRACELGNAMSMGNLALLYTEHNENWEMVFELLNKSIQLGSKRSYYFLGDIYLNGKNVDKNVTIKELDSLFS